MERTPCLIAFKATQETAAELKRIAAEEDRTVSSVIRRIINKAIAERRA